MDLLASIYIYKHISEYFDNQTPTTSTTSTKPTTSTTTSTKPTTSIINKSTAVNKKEDVNQYDIILKNTGLYYFFSFLTVLFILYCSLFSIYLSWSCNTSLGMSVILKIFYAFFAFLGGFSYIIFYVIFRVGTCHSTQIKSE